MGKRRTSPKRPEVVDVILSELRISDVDKKHRAKLWSEYYKADYRGPVIVKGGAMSLGTPAEALGIRRAEKFFNEGSLDEEARQKAIQAIGLDPVADELDW